MRHVTGIELLGVLSLFVPEDPPRRPRPKRLPRVKTAAVLKENRKRKEAEKARRRNHK